MKDLRKLNIELTRKKLGLPLEKYRSVIHCVRLLKEFDKPGSNLQLRLSQWYSDYKDDKIPETTKGVKEDDLKFIISINKEIKVLEKAKEKTEKYLLKLMEGFAPNLTKVAGCKLGAMLIEKAGSLEKLAYMPSSKIQILGAEKALFKHIKSGSKAPKHGLVILHNSVQEAEDKGKAARKLSAEISKAARIDFFRKKSS
jgi:nucleolar protein 56